MKEILKKGRQLFKIGKAVRKIRRSTDQETKNRAQQYLMEILGKSRGLPTKVGQFLSLESQDPLLNETLTKATPVMSYEEVAEQIEKAYHKSIDSLFNSFEKKGCPASLGQVHFAKLKSGQKVAVKVQYPLIGKSVETELKLLGWLPKVGPVSKWGFNLEGYRESFHSNFTQELDYLNEAQQQNKYFNLCSPLENIIIPEVFLEYGRRTVLVQSFVKGISLDQVEKLDEVERKGIGRALLNHYFHMLFRHGFVHCDPNPNNFAFQRGELPKVIIYDFGSVLQVSDKVRLGILRIISGIQNRDNIDPAACLALLGFDINKLRDLRPVLPALLQILFDPFILQSPYNTRDWKISERFEGVVGELKWWFRSAAPPELIFLMRVLHGLTQLLNRLNISLSWGFILNQQCGDLIEEARNIELPQLGESNSTFKQIAKFLKVYVKKTNGNKVELTMPGRVVEELEEVIDPPVLETIRNQGINLEDIQNRVRKTGFIPQTLFEVEDNVRFVKVWLE